MPQMFFVQYEVRPLPHNEVYAEVGGAYANCFLLAESEAHAEELARRNFSENLWEIVSLEEPASLASRSDLADEWLEWYDEAEREGECYVFHEWPNEPQDEDAVH